MSQAGNTKLDRAVLTDKQKRQIDAVLISYTQKAINAPEMCRQIEQITGSNEIRTAR